MAGVRKLQAEVDRTLKQIGEHLVEFDLIWEKVQVAPTPNLKEKYEADLKKEIKKLQRLRDAAKLYIAHHDLKNKKPLLDIRKVIEGKMEQFKVLEKETKTKAYSKEGLSLATRGGRGGGGEDEERRDACRVWLDAFSDALQAQMEEMEGRLEAAKAEGASSSKSKKKAKPGPGESPDDLTRAVDRLQFHLSQLSDVRDRLDDDSLSAEQVEGVKDSVEYFVNNNQEPDFQEDDSIYDELDLANKAQADDHDDPPDDPRGEAEAEAADVEEKDAEADDAGDDDRTTRATSPTKGGKPPLPAPSPTPPRPAPVNVNARTTGVINTGAGKASPAGGAVALPSPASAASPAAKSAVASSPPLIAPLTRITPTSASAAVAAAAKPPPAGPSLAANGRPAPSPAPVPAQTQVKPLESLASIVKKGTDEQRRTATTITPITPISALPSPTPVTAASKPPLPNPASAPAPKPAAAAVPAQVKAETATQRPPLIAPVMKINTASAAAASATPASSPSVSSAPSTPSFASTPSSPTPLSASISVASAPGASIPTHGPPSRPSSSASLNPPDDSSYSASPLPPAQYPQPIASPAPASAAPGGFDPAAFPFPPAGVSASSPASSTTSSPSTPAPAKERERGPVPDEYYYTLQLLESSLQHFPLTSDTDRPKPYTPRNPYRTPPYFPSLPPPIFDEPGLFEKLSVDTLFFIFYFQQGTPHQYLAARELKKQSWRYHKNFLTWFQRHDDPKLTSEEFEQGTYVYFDYESGWCQRIKADFTFEYRHLECEEIEGIAAQVTQFGRG